MPEPYELFSIFNTALLETQISQLITTRLTYLLTSVMYNSLGFNKLIFQQTDTFSTNGVFFDIKDICESNKLNFNLALYGMELINIQYLSNTQSIIDYIAQNTQTICVDPVLLEQAKQQIVNYLNYRYGDGWNVNITGDSLPNGTIRIDLDKIQDILSWPEPLKFTMIKGQPVSPSGGKWGDVIPPFKMYPNNVDAINYNFQYENIEAETLNVFTKSLNLTTPEKIYAEYWNGNIPKINGNLNMAWITYMIFYFKQHFTFYEDQVKKFNYLMASLFAGNIACWAVKFDILDARPIQTCRLIDGVPIEYYNGQKTISNLWNSYLNSIEFKHPNYTSGHACTSTTAAYVFQQLFGPDISEGEIILDQTAIDAISTLFRTGPGHYDLKTFYVPKGTVLIDGTVIEEDTPMDFTSWRQMAYNCSQSRFYAGVHYNFANEQGIIQGKLVYDNVVNEYASTLL